MDQSTSIGHRTGTSLLGNSRGKATEIFQYLSEIGEVVEKEL